MSLSGLASKGARVLWIARSYKYLAPNGAKLRTVPRFGICTSMTEMNTLEINSPDTLATILDECRTIAVVGLSSNSWRPSHGVASYMKRAGYRVIAVNPNETEVFGEKSFASLVEVPEKIDLVDIFRRSEEAGAAVDQAIAIGAKAIWLQEGVIDSQAAQRALDAGLLVVMDRCWLKEHARRKV